VLSPTLITAALASNPPPPHLYVGYSGGVDSHVLLHLCAALPQFKDKITAVYVHHGLQVEADMWAAHCGQTANALGLGFRLLRVHAHPQTGESPEAAARNARYGALKALLAKDDALLIAQHREDQLETVLLQLFRGGGLRGLAGMPEAMAFGAGVLLRPLLAVAKQAIDHYARQHALVWVEDPSNQSTDYDRNFLRNDIVPLLKTRWPALDKTVARSALHCAEAGQIIADVAQSVAAGVVDTDNHLTISALLAFSAVEQKLIVRHWFGRLGLPMPSAGFMDELFKTVIYARASANPQLHKGGCCIRRYQDKLYGYKGRPAVKKPESLVWRHPENEILLPDGSLLQRHPARSGIPIVLWQAAKVTIRFRAGGEKIALPNRTGSHSLKNLFQEAAIPPWQRDWVPLLYFDGRLVAVADLWLSSELQSSAGVLCYRLQWLKSPPH
jgi:tRNA(Ile)-lysidine synthase